MEIESFMAGFCFGGAFFHTVTVFLTPAYELFFVLAFTALAIIYGVIA